PLRGGQDVLQREIVSPGEHEPARAAAHPGRHDRFSGSWAGAGTSLATFCEHATHLRIREAGHQVLVSPLIRTGYRPPPTFPRQARTMIRSQLARAILAPGPSGSERRRDRGGTRPGRACVAFAAARDEPFTAARHSIE